MLDSACVRRAPAGNGRATLSKDLALLRQLAAGDKPALLVARIALQECFFHCAKAFIRSGAWEPASWAPKAAWSRLFGMAPATVAEVLDHDHRHKL